jgi:phage terminase large subunit-like protein
VNRLQREALYAELFKTCGRDGFKEAARRLCLTDLYFLLTKILGRTDMERDWLYERCMEVQDSPNGHLDLWAREHYKSTIITFGKTIQDILANPEITVGIFSFNRPIAKAFLRQIKREFESNETLRELFPDVLWESPHRDAPKWSEDEGIIVRRKGNPKEATVEAWGLVDAQPTSKHYSLVIYDDVVTKDSVTTPDMIAKVTEAWELSLALGSDGGHARYIGTRYHANDTYKTILDRKSAVPRIYPATTDGKVEGEPVLLSREALTKKRRDMGPYTFGCQMLQDPAADKVQGFKDGWLRFWKGEKTDGLNLYMIFDPASGKKKVNDYTCAKIIGLGSDGNYYVVAMARDRLNLTERGRLAMKWHRLFKPKAVGYEEYGLQADIEFIQYLQEQENYRFSIIPLAGKLSKEDRIRKLIPIYEQGKMYLPGSYTYVDHEGVYRDMTREFVEQEYRAFPVAVHDDMLDCQARILDPALGAVFPDELAGMRAATSQPVRDYNPLNGLQQQTTNYNPFGGLE